MRTRLVAIIDDDVDVCSSLADFAHSTGYFAESFHSAESFLESSDLSAFGCAVIDIHMPGMGGLNLARTLATRIPVILITAQVDGDLEDAAAAAGALCLLRKPFETAVLLEWIEMSFSDDFRKS